MASEAPLQLEPAGRKPKGLLLALMMVPLAITCGVVAWGTPSGLRQVLATGQGTAALWTLSGTAAFVVALWALLHAALHRHDLKLDGERLRIATTFYTRSVALSDLLLDKARVVALDERTELRPALKLNGFALPGFHSGHFRLHNQASAFVAIAGGPKVLWLPTLSGKGLLLQPRRPEALLQRLHELARPGHPR